jgi:hypothetical protein
MPPPAGRRFGPAEMAAHLVQPLGNFLGEPARCCCELTSHRPPGSFPEAGWARRQLRRLRSESRKQRQLRAGEEAQAEPAEDVIHQALGVADLLVAGPARRLEAGVRKLLAQHLERNAMLQASEIEVAKASIRPETVEPSLAILMKISPGWPVG